MEKTTTKSVLKDCEKCNYSNKYGQCGLSQANRTARDLHEITGGHGNLVIDMKCIKK